MNTPENMTLLNHATIIHCTICAIYHEIHNCTNNRAKKIWFKKEMIHCLRSLNCTHLVHGWLSKIEDDCKKKLCRLIQNFIYLANIRNVLIDIEHSFILDSLLQSINISKCIFYHKKLQQSCRFDTLFHYEILLLNYSKIKWNVFFKL